MQRFIRPFTLVSVAAGLAAGLTLVGCGDDDPVADSPDTSADAVADVAADADDADAGGATDAGDDAGDDAALDGDPEDVAVAPVEVGELQVIAHPTNPLARYVEWTTDRPATGRLTVTCGDDLDLSVETEAATFRSVFVSGLYEGAACELQVATVADDGGVGEATGSFDVPTGELGLPDNTLVAATDGAFEPGWTLFGLNNGFDNAPFVLAMVDEAGRYRWIHRVATARFGTDNEVARIDDGILIAGTRREIQPRIIAWDGEVRWQEPVYMHHDARYLGDRLVYLVHEDTCEWSEKGGSIHERSFETGEVVWQFDLCEHVPPQEMFDWAHVNTVEPTPEGDYLLSVRNMHHVSYIDRDARSVRWRMGYDGDFTLPEGQDWFLRQHAPELQPNGNILIFDNGFVDEGRLYSRAVEYAIDTDTMEAEVVWEYRHDPDIFSPIQGDADRLSGGTTLITFSQRSRTEPTRLIEVDAGGTVVWQLDIGLPWGIYRSDRIEPPPLIFAVE